MNSLITKFLTEQVLERELDLNPFGRSHTSRTLILLEAKKRGCTAINFGGNTFGIEKGGRIVATVRGQITSLAGSNGVAISGSKVVSKELVSRRGVPTVAGQAFMEHDFSNAIEYFEQLGRPAVVKPSKGWKGKGISTNVTDLKGFEKGWTKALNEQKGAIMVEEYVEGIDVRLYVVGGEVVAAVSRVPAFVVGTGRDSIEQLIESSIQRRKVHAYISSLPICPDEVVLERQGLGYSSKPADGELVFLNSTANVTQGGYNIDVTDLIGPEVRHMAVTAVDAFPGLNISGIDFLVKDFKGGNPVVFLESNPDAAVMLHHYPSYGDARDVAGRVVDLLLA